MKIEIDLNDILSDSCPECQARTTTGEECESCKEQVSR